MTEISESLWEQAVEAFTANTDVSDLVNRMADSGVSLALWKVLKGKPLYAGDLAMIGQLFDACHAMHSAIIAKVEAIEAARDYD